MVALNPTLAIPGESLFNLSMLKDKCTPRLFSASACISSMISHWTSCRWSTNFWLVSRIARLSGVQIRMWGGFLSISAFSFVVVSPVLTPACRFYPTCSNYAYEAITQYGLAKGGFLALKRVLKCHPFHSGGIDLVP